MLKNKTIMKRLIITLHILLATIAVSFHASASEQDGNDSIYVYDTWQGITASSPSSIVINPFFRVHTCLEYSFDAESQARSILRSQALAIAIGDSTWLVNGHYLQQHYSCSSRIASNYMPLYFSAKIAFFRYAPAALSNDELLYNAVTYYAPTVDALIANADIFMFDTAPYYIIDTKAHTVNEVDWKFLSKLLERYPDLLRRYTMMKDYKKTPIVNFFFMEYVDRYNSDPATPPLTDGGNTENPEN